MITDSRAETIETLRGAYAAFNRGDLDAAVKSHVQAKDTGQWQQVRLADVYTFRNGKAVQMRAFTDRREALRWVGIEDPITPGNKP